MLAVHLAHHVQLRRRTRTGRQTRETYLSNYRLTPLGTGSRLTARSIIANMLVRKAMEGDLRAVALILASEGRQATSEGRLVVKLAQTLAPDRSISASTRTQLIEVVAHQAIDRGWDQNVSQADTGTALDLINHFLITGQLPAHEADKPEFFAQVREVLRSKDNPEGVLPKLVERLNDAFGSSGVFEESARQAEELAASGAEESARGAIETSDARRFDLSGFRGLIELAADS